MKWSWRLITIRGIDIKVHLTFALALIWGAFMWSGGRLQGAIYGLVLTLVLFGIVLLHELGHAFAAQHYGIPVQDIILLPIGGVARLSHMPEDPRQELVVAIAGPAVNLALGFLAAPLLLLGLLLQGFTGEAVRWPSMIDPGFLNFVAYFVMVNVSLLLFNMLPAFPMDGGRVLRAFLAQRMAYARATHWAVRIGRSFAVLFGAYAIMSGNFFLGIVAFFVFQGAGQEQQEVAEAQAARNTPMRDLSPARPPELLADTPAQAAFERLMRSPYAALPVVNNQGDLVGLITRTGMRRRWEAGQRGPVGGFVDRPVELGSGPWHVDDKS